MDIEEFRIRGKEMVEYICEFMSNIHNRRVTPDVGPGYLRPLLPSEAPQQPEAWEDIMKDVESKIMPGITHWQHPRFHAYFPAGNSFPSILGDMLSDAIGCIGFSWAIEADTAEGFVPFFVSTTLGTTACCSFDNLKEIGPIFNRNT